MKNLYFTSISDAYRSICCNFDDKIYNIGVDESVDKPSVRESFYSPSILSSEDNQEVKSTNVENLKSYIDSLDSARSINVFLNYDIMNLLTFLRGKFNLKSLGNGSSRLVFLADNGHVVKISYNKNGILQNNAEAHDYRVKNAYGCFSKIYWKSRNGLMIECEKCDTIDSYSDFEKVTGVDFLDYLGFLDFSTKISNGTKDGGFDYESDGYEEYENMKDENERASAVLYNPKNSNRAAIKVLKNLADYVINRTSDNESFLKDLLPQNWGITTRDGEKVVVLIDSGGTDSVINNY